MVYLSMKALRESEKNHFFIRSGIALLPPSKSFYKVLWLWLAIGPFQNKQLFPSLENLAVKWRRGEKFGVEVIISRFLERTCKVTNTGKQTHPDCES